LKLCTNMKWHCQGDANDHHSVIQCAPDKIPQLAPNQVCAYSCSITCSKRRG